MFKAIVSAATPRDAFDSANTLADECKIRLNEESLPIHIIDPMNVGMMDLTLDVAAFGSCEAHGGVIGVNFSRLKEVAGMAGVGDLTHLTLGEEMRKLNIRIDGLPCTLALIDPDPIRQKPDIPDLNPTADIVLEETYLDRGIKTADVVPGHIRLRVDGAEGTFHVETGDDTDDTDLSLPPASFTSVGAGVTDSLFSLDYLKDMNKVISTDAEVIVRLGEEFPVKLHYRVAKRMGVITYMLALRIQSD